LDLGADASAVEVDDDDKEAGGEVEEPIAGKRNLFSACCTAVLKLGCATASGVDNWAVEVVVEGVGGHE
jgi:hypothetical protein